MIPNPQRRHAMQWLALAAAAPALATPALAHQVDDGEAADGTSARRDRLYISSNATAGNALLVLARHPGGPATLLGSVATGGTGTGAGLGSQGAVALSTSGRHLFVVNAGSNSVSTFRLTDRGPVLVSTVASGGLRPISVAEADGIVYVLNAPAAGTGNLLAGFRNDRGTLRPLTGGLRSLPDASGPAQVGFDAEGEVLVVTLKSSNQVSAWRVQGNGALAPAAEVTASPGPVPFGFAITRRNVLIVSEAATSSASSYRIDDAHPPALRLVTGALSNGQAAACWIAVTPDGRFAYSANAAASNVSAYAVDRAGGLTLLQAQAGFTSNNGALDMAVTPDGRQLHVFAPRAPQQIVSFAIAADGSLTRLGVIALAATSGAGLVAN